MIYDPNNPPLLTCRERFIRWFRRLIGRPVVVVPDEGGPILPPGSFPDACLIQQREQAALDRFLAEMDVED